MKILHTSDWHIGRTLYGRKRYEEFEAFLTWLAETIQQNEIDALLVAGDVFDTSAPSNRAQELYYRFLCRVAASSCRHVVVVAGNHDSPSFLNAPKELLKALDVHVVGSSTESPEDEVLVLCNEQDAPELIVCAVPYLRDRDIRVAEAGESVEDKERKLIEGIRTHYTAVAALAEHDDALMEAYVAEAPVWFCEALGVFDRQILAAAVAVVNQSHTLCRAAIMHRLFQGIENEPRMRRGADPPAHDASGKHIDDESHVQPALPGRDVGEVRHPQLVRPVGAELPLHPVQRARRLGIGHPPVRIDISLRRVFRIEQGVGQQREPAPLRRPHPHSAALTRATKSD